MSTDRELLKLAAKAAGIADGDVFYDMERDKVWNPRDDDGDALRLAVKLNMVLRIENYGTSARSGKNGRWHNFEAHLYGGINAATRRVIVRAAAEIGKAMP